MFKIGDHVAVNIPGVSFNRTGGTIVGGPAELEDGTTYSVVYDYLIYGFIPSGLYLESELKLFDKNDPPYERLTVVDSEKGMAEEISQ